MTDKEKKAQEFVNIISGFIDDWDFSMIGGTFEVAAAVLKYIDQNYKLINIKDDSCTNISGNLGNLIRLLEEKHLCMT